MQIVYLSGGKCTGAESLEAAPVNALLARCKGLFTAHGGGLSPVFNFFAQLSLKWTQSLNGPGRDLKQEVNNMNSLQLHFFIVRK